jgi:2-oxoglutarate dehydrogenase complex dehydrogenase (E1) component-like enzyme
MEYLDLSMGTLSLVQMRWYYGKLSLAILAMVHKLSSTNLSAAGESKWQRPCGMVMLLLPHGYEGQGPEHSSARLERFLQQCAELNMVVVNITDPANFFHAIAQTTHLEFQKTFDSYVSKIITPSSTLCIRC